MEVQVDEVAVIELELIGMSYKALLQAQQVHPVKAVGVCGNRGALGQNVELSKEPEPWIEAMLRDMGVALGAEKLEGKKREKVAECRDRLGSWQSSLLHHLGQVELFDERGKKKDPGALGVKGLLSGVAELDPLSDRRHLGALDGHSKLKPRPSRQSRVALFGQDPFNSADRDLHPFFGKKLSDLTGRQTMLSPVTDFGLGFSVNATPFGLALGHWLGEVDLPVSEEMSEEIDIGNGIPEALGHYPGRQSIEEGGPQCLVAALPLMHRMEEVVFVAHGGLI